MRFGRKIGAERCVALALVLVMSAVAMAAEEDSQKPEDWERRLEMLRSVPYIDVTEEEVEEGSGGVLYYVPEKAYDGYNFYCTKRSGEAFLLDMNGELVNRWTYRSAEEKTGSDHAVLLKKGDLIIIRMNNELARINWDSEVIWKREMAAHHDVTPAPDGSFYAITREKKDHRGLSVWFDVMEHVTAAGQEIDRWSTFDHLDELKAMLDTRSFLDTVLDRARGNPPPKIAGIKDSSQVKRGKKREHIYDYFHMNTITILPATPLGEEDPRFQPGNLLVCFCNVNQIAVLERGTYRLLWSWGEGELEGPHHPTLLENGRILIFDNGTVRQRSRVIEVDPLAGEIIWEYAQKPPEVFFSYTRGSAQRLPNGNTLICESDKGRAFEITRDGEIVWMWLNPITKHNNRETVYRMIRHPVDVVEGLLEKP